MELIECLACGEPIPTQTSECWACGYASHRSPALSSDGLSSIASAVVIVAVFAVVLVGIVGISQRERLVAEDATHQASAAEAARIAAERALLARMESREPTPSPTPLPSDSPGRHLVRRGESLFSLAGDFGVSANELIF